MIMQLLKKKIKQIYLKRKKEKRKKEKKRKKEGKKPSNITAMTGFCPQTYGP